MKLNISSIEEDLRSLNILFENKVEPETALFEESNSDQLNQFCAQANIKTFQGE